MNDYGYIIHSAKGTTWTKKDHKYIKKINGVYYYGTSKELSSVRQGYYNIDKNAKESVENQEKAEEYRKISDWNFNKSKEYDRKSKANKVIVGGENVVSDSNNTKANRHRVLADNYGKKMNEYNNKSRVNQIYINLEQTKMERLTLDHQVKRKIKDAKRWIKHLFS